ncbi:LysR substrate-binding domain-containing protein [Lichenicoccus roseus]|uniref:LysR family transcriptional regulator n=1 Tax=Lichenicoccus roseus TaxID=2683649 RepID=A0A5R9JJH7_9PROT|nr:LysR substrate-binding domain-containing protein [Lichenicoccus roseus]TLU74508.1 LysR family transcriptional regulator [Lichenicoccus roseus]
MTRTHLGGLSLRDLQYALAVAELRHFGRAADQCGVSQPALSEQIRKLEALLGTRLFERTARRIEVTSHGETLLRQARIVLREAAGLLELASARSDPLAGPLQVGVIPTLGPYYLPLVLRALRDRFPGLELRLQEGRTVELVEQLQRGQLDAMLAALPLGDGQLDSRALFFERFQLLLPAGHALLDAASVQPTDLPGHDLLLLEEGHCLRDQAVSLCSLPGARGGDARHASSLEMLRHMVAAGEGYTLMPQLATRITESTDLLDGLLQARPLDPATGGAMPGRTIGMAWRATDPRGPHFARLADFLRERAPAGTDPVG